MSGNVFCWCNSDDPFYCTNNSCTAIEPDGLCFYHLTLNREDATEIPLFGCTPPAETGFLTCKGGLSPHRVLSRMACCRSREEKYCNLNLTLELPQNNDFSGEQGQIGSDNLYIIFLVVSVVILLFALGFIVVCCIRKKKSHWWKSFDSMEKGHLLSNNGDKCSNGQELQKLLEQSSGSGSGLPLMVQRTVARSIQIHESIGKGRYGEVYRATWRYSTVAVKKFCTFEEQSWKRECEIYQTVMLRHPNILSFIAADINGTGSCTEMLLITEFAELGSLYDLLGHNIALTLLDCLHLAHTAAEGIDYLHTNVNGNNGKPEIAHRDIKSKNILVKRGYICAIADFGLALRKGDDYDVSVSNQRVGTIRYMAPELLEQRMSGKSFDDFKCADVYSFGLVLWEIVNKCSTKCCQYGEFRMPYHDLVPMKPSYDDMRKVVCERRLQPTLPVWMNHCDTTEQLGSLIKECWEYDRELRPRSLRVHKKLTDLKEDVEALEDDVSSHFLLKHSNSIDKFQTHLQHSSTQSSGLGMQYMLSPTPTPPDNSDLRSMINA